MVVRLWCCGKLGIDLIKEYFEVVRMKISRSHEEVLTEHGITVITKITRQ